MKFSAATASLLSATATTVSGFSSVAPTLKPDANAFAYGLPGALEPVGAFDPFGFTDGKDFDTIKGYREAELQHGRVAMLASLGMLVTEKPIEFHPLFQAANRDIGPAIRHLDEVRASAPLFVDAFFLFIGYL